VDGGLKTDPYPPEKLIASESIPREKCPTHPQAKRKGAKEAQGAQEKNK